MKLKNIIYKLLIISILLSLIIGCSTSNDELNVTSENKPSENSIIVIESNEEEIGEKETETFIIGDYIVFGAYNKEPILWRISDIDDEQCLKLISEYIICYKAYDAAESGFDEMMKDGLYHLESETHNWEEAFGDIKWKSSNIREWLNSQELEVEYTTQEPNSEAVTDSEYAYANEAGFLTNFTEYERSLINDTEVKTVSVIKEEYEYMNQLVLNDENEPIVTSGNFDELEYTLTVDKVFLLSVEELIDAIQNEGWDMVKRNVDPEISLNVYGENDPYFLRTPRTDHLFGVYTYYSPLETIGRSQANDSECGIVPVMWIDSMSEFKGEGTLENPYYLDY